MKTKFILLATALFCLASCNNAELDNGLVDKGGNSSVAPSGDVYTIEIEGSDPATKGGKAEVQSMGYASLSGTGRQATPKATLYKNKVAVSGASYTWSLINSGGSYISLGNDSKQQALLTGKAIKSQANLVHVKGTDGVGSAEVDVPVVVTDNLTVDWEKPSMTLPSGEQDQNTVVTNHKDASVTVSCPSNCKIGETKSNLGTSDIKVTTGDDGKATVYVQYTGTSNTTLNLKAVSGSHSATASIVAKELVIPPTKVSWGLRYASTGALTAVLFDSNGKEKERAQFIYPLETYTFSNVQEGDYLDLYHPDDWVLSTDNGSYKSVRGAVNNLPAYGHRYDCCDTP